MRRVDFVPANHIYVRVRVLPVLAICPPRALLKTTLKPDATLRDVVQVADAIGVFKGGQIWLKVESSFSIHKGALASFSRPTADRTYSSYFRSRARRNEQSQ
jgi:hypothetical protein